MLFSKLSDDVVLTIFAKLEEDPRNWARLSCVCTKFTSLIRSVCCKSKCKSSIPSVVSDLLSDSPSSIPGGWSSLYKLSVCCPGLVHSGVLLENSDFGLERELGPDENYHHHHYNNNDKTVSTASHHQQPESSTTGNTLENPDSTWSLYDDLYYDTVYDASESHDVPTANTDDGVPMDTTTSESSNSDSSNKTSDVLGGEFSVCKKRKLCCRSLRSHLASGVWNLSREQGNKLLASRFREDCLYICDWPGCLHREEKRNYMLFRGIFKNFKRSRVWRTINDGNRSKIPVNCAFCACKETWDLHSAFCFRRGFGYHDDGEPSFELMFVRMGMSLGPGRICHCILDNLHNDGALEWVLYCSTFKSFASFTCCIVYD